MSHFPLDLATQLFILPNFPVKSLLRFRCLSKSFCSHIDSPDFIKKRLKTSMDTKTNLKLILPHGGGDDGPVDLYAADFDDGLKQVIKLNNPVTAPNRYTIICGSCDGLILLGTGNSDICEDYVVWNPTTRQSRKLPVCPITTLPGHKFFCGGLGYDSTTDDYKVVMMAAVSVADKGECCQVWIFNLRSNSWRMIQDVPPYNEIEYSHWRRYYTEINVIIESSFMGFFINGALYWQCFASGFFQIFGFDLASEVFITLPHYDGRVTSHNLMDLGGYLHTVNLSKLPETHEYYLFKRDDIGTGGNWVRVFKFEDQCGTGYLWVTPLAYSKEGDCVLISKYQEFFWYNIEKKTREMVELEGMPRPVKGKILSYVCWESLVSPDPGGHDI
ncbi:hypothetical protein SLA2020_173430 [Shorea laevis]